MTSTNQTTPGAAPAAPAPQTVTGAAFTVTTAVQPGAAFTVHTSPVRMEDRTTWILDVLPLRRDNPGEIWPELGLLINGAPIVYLCNAFEPGLTARLKTCPTEVYSTWDDLRAAGWVVD